jgi:hypothetical protein
MVQPDRAQITTYYGACALHAGKVRLHTHPGYVTLNALTATVVTQKRLNVAFVRTLPVLLKLSTVHACIFKLISSLRGSPLKPCMQLVHVTEDSASLHLTTAALPPGLCQDTRRFAIIYPACHFPLTAAIRSNDRHASGTA